MKRIIVITAAWLILVLPVSALCLVGVWDSSIWDQSQWDSNTYTVTPSANAGGTITPGTAQIVTSGATTNFTVTPNTNYTATVSGCNGTHQAGNSQLTYTTGAITADCTVTATFNTITICPEYVLYVCGTDGKTYANICFASAAGISIAYQGACNAACGTANNTTVNTAPMTNLCSSGTATIETGSGPWSWDCTVSNGGTTANCSANYNPPSVKVFMSSASPEAFTVATSGTKLYGGASREVITITNGVNNVTLDQNIDRFNLPGISESYSFKQAGNQLVVYDSAGITPIVTIPIQGDSDGTQIGFTNGTYDVKLNSGQISIGGSVVSSGTPGYIYPVTQTSTVEPVLSTTSTAGVYLSNNDTTISNSGAKVYGSGYDALTISANTDSISFDQNIGQVKLGNNTDSYKFQQTGNIINIYDQTGTTLITKGPVQPAPGTKLTFSNGYAYVVMATGGVMKLGGTAVSTNIPTAISMNLLTP